MLFSWTALEAAIVSAKEQGGVPFFVGSTAGTTVLGAFDPLLAICEVYAPLLRAKCNKLNA